MRFARRTRSHSSLIAILFHIEVELSVSSTPFVSLDEISYYSDKEKEVLFSMHTVFRVGEMKEIEDCFWQVNLLSTSDNDQHLTELTQHMRNRIKGTTGMHRMGQLTITMGEWNKAEEIYTILLRRTSGDDHPQLAFLHHQLGYINEQKSDLSNALSHYKQSLGIFSTHLPNNPQVSVIYSNIGVVLRAQGDLDGALEHFERTLAMYIHAPQPDQLNIATCHNIIGSTLMAQCNYAEALTSYERALEIRLRHLPSRHPSLAITYNNIGTLHSSMKEYSKALSYFKKTLEIREKSLPPYHPSMATIYSNIAVALENLYQYKEAFEQAIRAVDIARHAFGSDHPDVQMYQNHLDQLR
jgi:tetratricopeptide (TPR) repeat protein